MTRGLFSVARIIAAWTLFLSASDALACSRKPGGYQAEFNEAKYVFTALVTRAEFHGFVDPESNPNAPRPLGFVYAEYELIEALKGTPSKKGAVVTINLIYGACGGVPI